jgi:hypothetical protein
MYIKWPVARGASSSDTCTSRRRYAARAIDSGGGYLVEVSGEVIHGFF